MKRYISMLLFFFMTLCVIQCDSVSDTLSGITGDEDDEKEGWCDKELDESEAAAINVKLIREITGLYDDVGSYSNPDYPDYESDDGSVKVEGEYTTYPYYFKFKFKFDGYSGTYLDIDEGEVTYIDEVDDMTSIHYWKYKDGYFNITVDDEEYEVWWDFEEYNKQGMLYYDGEFKICESEFDYEGSSK